MNDHNKLMDYMTKLSIALNKTVVLTPENDTSIILISVGKGDIKLYFPRYLWNTIIFVLRNMRIDPTLIHQKKRKEKLLAKTEIVTRKVAIGFVVVLLVFLFLKMILPSSV